MAPALICPPASTSAGSGATELKTLWRDPDYDPNQSAFYYVRVLMNPTCRWSSFDAIRLGREPDPSVPATIQERAWSSRDLGWQPMTMEVYESMTQQDYQSDLPGYYQNSTCATEYGGVRRQKHARSPGLNIQPGEILKASSRRFARGRWVVGTFNADNRLYVFGCSVPSQPDVSIGWVEEVDPITLETIRQSPDLKTGGHNWCGGAAVLADGTLITGFGNRIHKLTQDLELIAELELPVDHAHNGISLLSDGMMITRNLEHDHSKKSVFTVFDPHTLEVLISHEYVGASIGRFCVDPTPEGDFIYATTPTHIHRLKYNDQQLELDKNWGASYDSGR